MTVWSCGPGQVLFDLCVCPGGWQRRRYTCLVSIAGLDVWLRSRAAADLFSGVVLIRRGERTLFAGAYGWASRRWAAPVTLTTRFDTASITKLFTAVAALQLVDQGRLDLDTPIVDVVDLTASAISPVVTVRQLLTHTSGIADDADEEAGEDYEALWADKPCYSVIQTRDWLPQFAHKPAVFPPGDGCRYCNVGYILVGLAIEAVTGVDYRDHVRGAVFGRADMAASDFYDRREAATDVAEGWDPVLDAAGHRTGWKQNIFSYPPIGSPDGGAQVTAADLVSFAQAVRAGRLLSAELTERFLTPQVLHHRRDDWAVWYGFGLEFVTDNDGTVRNYYKDGANAGASGIVRYYPTDQLDVVVLSNSAAGAWPAIDEIHRRIRADNPGIGESGVGFR
jgi:CubicO group peptidase (beta-lactamase class C family)